MASAVPSAAPRRRRLSAQERCELIERAATEVFAEHGYHRASVDEIARRAGITPPVLYDHFTSKRALHERLLERHYGELREVWRRNLPGPEPAGERIGRAFDAWFAYVEANPYACRMLFRDATGDPELQALHRDVEHRSRAEGLHLLADEPGSEHVAGPQPLRMQMAWEIFRGSLQALALWWYEHPEVPRADIVATAMNALWTGLERVRDGERWRRG